MIIYPITSVNNFFKNPEKIIKLSKKFKYTKASDGSWPGIRTNNLSTTNYNFFKHTILSVLYMYYGSSEAIEFDKASLFFHRIKPYASSKTDRRNKGWIHKDNCSLGGIIYLNKTALPESGTSLYTPKKEPILNDKHIKTKIDYFKDGKINLTKYKNTQLDLEKKFIKTHTFENNYNTMVAFDGHQWHACDNYCVGEKKERLSLVFFIHKIRANDTPRMRLDHLQSRL
jgi:hypothetical protein|tara:strand:+ start:1142 stop:1825 length:684 start_codon:yes stop_codon:yes gene_type:complete